MLSRLKAILRPAARTRPIELDDGLYERVSGRFPALHHLDHKQRVLLKTRCREILNTKSFQGAGDFAPQDDDCLAVALLAALPVLHLGLDGYRDFHTFILYPAPFIADIEEVDEDGLVHSGRDLRSGEAWARGPVVLAMNDVWDSGQGEGFNVVVHELAHQLDQLNGEANGFPPLHAGMDAGAWTRAFSAGFERLLTELEQGLEPSIDPYGAESPAEFFAVACEFYFDVPDWLAENHSQIHAQLAKFFMMDQKDASRRVAETQRSAE